MITGVGTDIVSVARLATVFERQGERFIERVLHSLEQAEMPADPVQRFRFLARRWAAKEAFAKAMGTGIRAEVALSAIVIRHDALGRPYFEYSAELQKTMTSRRQVAHVSISDESDYAVAFVVVVEEDAVYPRP